MSRKIFNALGVDAPRAVYAFLPFFIVLFVLAAAGVIRLYFFAEDIDNALAFVMVPMVFFIFAENVDYAVTVIVTALIPGVFLIVTENIDDAVFPLS